MSTFKQKKALNVQLAAAQKKYGDKSQAAGRIQYKLNQLTKNSKGSVVRSKNGIVKTATGPVRTTDTSPKKMRTVTKLKTPLADRGPSSGTGTVKKVVKKAAPVQRELSSGSKFSKTTTKKVTPVKKVIKKETTKKVIPTVQRDRKGFGSRFPKKVTQTTFKPTNPKVLENISVAANKQSDNKKLWAEYAVNNTPAKIAEKQAANRLAIANRDAELKGKGKAKKAAKVTQQEKSDAYSKNKKEPSFLSGIIDKMKTTQATRKRLAASKKVADKKAAVRKEAYDKRMAVKAKREADAKAAKAKAKQIADKKALYEKRLAAKKAADKKVADKKAVDKKAADKKAAAKKLAAETYWNNTQGKVRTRQAARNKKLKENK